MYPDLLTIQEAADRLGVSRWRIYALIRAGRLPAIKLGRDWIVQPADLQLVADRKPGYPAGRPRKTRLKIPPTDHHPTPKYPFATASIAP